MATSAFSLKGDGDGMAIPPFSLKGDDDGMGRPQAFRPAARCRPPDKCKQMVMGRPPVYSI